MAVHVPKYVRVASLHHLRIAPRHGRAPFAYINKPAKPPINAAFDRFRLLAPCHLPPVGSRTVHPAAVARLGRVLTVPVIVQRAQFVTQVQQRHATYRDSHTVQQQNPPDTQLYLLRVAPAQARFEPRQRCRRARDARVPRAWVLLKWQTPRKAPLEAARVEP